MSEFLQPIFPRDNSADCEGLNQAMVAAQAEVDSLQTAINNLQSQIITTEAEGILRDQMLAGLVESLEEAETALTQASLDYYNCIGNYVNN